jgi:hypothetical protein
MLLEASVPQSKLAKGFGKHMFKGEGNAFLSKKNQGNTYSLKPQHYSQNRDGPMPMRRVTLLGKIVCINHRIS